MKTIFFFNSSVLRKKKICLLCGAAYQWRFFLYVVEFCWSHFRDRQISLVETGTFPDFRKKICRLVTQFERFQRNRLGPPIAEKLFKRKTKENKQSCFCPCKRIGRNWSKVNDRYIRYNVLRFVLTKRSYIQRDNSGNSCKKIVNSW